MHGGADDIRPYVEDFINYALQHPELEFLVTPIGCGIAGFTPQSMAPLFRRALQYGNIVLPKSFVEVLTNHSSYTNLYILSPPQKKNTSECSFLGIRTYIFLALIE